MSLTRIPATLRRKVALRADFLCEYCLLHEDDTYFGCEIDHIISEKHSGLTQEDNLAYACFACNRSDIASLVPSTERLAPLFHPRRDRWHEHFRLSETDGITFIPRSDVGEVTLRLLRINDPDRLLERRTLRQAGRYPVTLALPRINTTS